MINLFQLFLGKYVPDHTAIIKGFELHPPMHVGFELHPPMHVFLPTKN